MKARLEELFNYYKHKVITKNKDVEFVIAEASTRLLSFDVEWWGRENTWFEIVEHQTTLRP